MSESKDTTEYVNRVENVANELYKAGHIIFNSLKRQTLSRILHKKFLVIDKGNGMVY